MFEKNAKKEVVRQTISLSSTFKFLFRLSTLCNNSSLDFYFLLECDTHITGVHNFSSNKNSDTISTHMVVYASIILGCSTWREAISPLGSVWTQGQGVTAAFSLLGCWVQPNVPDTSEMLFHDQFLGAWCINVYFSTTWTMHSS